MRARFLHTDAFRLAAIYTAVFALSMAVLGFSVLLINRDALRGQMLQFARADNAAVLSGYQSEKLAEAREVIQQRMSAPGASDYFLLQQNGRAVAGNLPAMAARTGVVQFSGKNGHDILGVGQMLAPGLYVFSGSRLARARAAERRILATMSWLFGRMRSRME